MTLLENLAPATENYPEDRASSTSMRWVFPACIGMLVYLNSKLKLLWRPVYRFYSVFWVFFFCLEPFCWSLTCVWCHDTKNVISSNPRTFTAFSMHNFVLQKIHWTLNNVNSKKEKQLYRTKCQRSILVTGMATKYPTNGSTRYNISYTMLA